MEQIQLMCDWRYPFNGLDLRYPVKQYLKKCLVKKGTKYPERITNSAKSSANIMLCGSVSGELLPIHVVYKAENMYQNCVKGGPPEARYACTHSSWFESQTILDWFRNIFYLIAEKNVDKITALIVDRCRVSNSLA